MNKITEDIANNGIHDPNSSGCYTSSYRSRLICVILKHCSNNWYMISFLDSALALVLTDCHL